MHYRKYPAHIHDHLQDVCVAFLKLHTPRETRLFLEDMLTPQELASLGERWQIFKLLAKGTSQRKVRDILNVSISKVSRGARAWRTSEGGVPLIMKRYYH